MKLRIWWTAPAMSSAEYLASPRIYKTSQKTYSIRIYTAYLPIYSSSIRIYEMYLDVEGVEDGLLDGGDVGVQDGHLHVLQRSDGLDQLPGPAPGQDLDHGVRAQRAHLDVSKARLVLGHLLPEPAGVGAAGFQVQYYLGGGAVTVASRRHGEREARRKERRRRRRRYLRQLVVLLSGDWRAATGCVNHRPWRVAGPAVQAPPLLRFQALDQLL